LLVFLCVSCASSNHGITNEKIPPKIECINNNISSGSAEVDVKISENDCEQPVSNPIGAIIQGSISMGILLALIL
jgi:hypothetical protein